MPWHRSPWPSYAVVPDPLAGRVPSVATTVEFLPVIDGMAPEGRSYSQEQG
jgi:hypothetical protein